MAVAVLLTAVAAASATAQVDPSGSWRTLHTSHFRIHFRPEYRGMATVAANEAERAWSLLAGELVPPRGVVDLTLGDDADIANGYATPVPSNRLTVLMRPPSDEPSLQHYDSWLRIVIVHELAHLFHLDRTGGIWRLLQAGLGRAPGVFPNSYQPSWVVEGVATYYESRFTGGGRVTGEFHTEILAAQAAGGATRSPWNATYYTPWPAGLGPYAYGSRFLSWAADSAADSLVPRLTAATSKQLIPFRVGRPYRRVTGRPLPPDWRRATVPTIDTSARGTLIVGALRQAPMPRVTSDGRLVAYLHDEGRRAPELRIVQREGWRLLRAHTVTSGVSYDWLGDTLVVAQLDFTSRRHIRSDLYRWLPDGGWRRETRNERIIQPRAGGGVLAVIALTPGGQQPYVGRIPLADTAGTNWGDIVPSPDARSIAATRHRDGFWSLVQWPESSPDSVTVLLSTQDVITDPVWGADGTLYFVMPVAGISQVHAWTDRGPMAITRAPLGARSPAPLPTGSFIYSTLSGNGWELRMGDPALPEAAIPAAPITFEPAATVATEETGYTSWPSARPHYWLPLFIDAGFAGRFFGISTSGNDAVGKFTYVTHALVSGAPERAIAGITIVDDAFGNPSLDLSASNDWKLIGVTSSGISVSELSYDAALGATFATRRWRRSASLRLALESEGSRFRTDPVVLPITAVCSGCRDRDFVGGSVSIRLARFVSAPLSVSAEDGFTWSVTLRRREEQGTARWSSELQSRLGIYARLPRVGFAHPVLALRLAGGVTHGPSPLFFGVGGVSSSVVDLGFGIRLGSTRSFPVRGYLPGDLRGRRAITGTAELRWPVALVGQSLGHLPGGLDRLWVSFFADAGDAWDPTEGPHPSHLIGLGAEAVADLRVSYDLPFRARVGVAYPAGTMPLSRALGLRAYAALGADF